MSTRSRIGIALPSGKVKSIYCHFDGYPEGVGKILKEHYTDPKKIEELLNLGDISSLGVAYDENISKGRWEDTPENFRKAENMTVAYKDRGEDVKFRIDDNEYDYISKAGNCCEEYVYLYKKDYTGVYCWHFIEVPYFKELTNEDIKGEEND